MLPLCCGCLRGFPRHFQLVRTLIRTVWNGPWNAATSRTATSLRIWLTDALLHGSGRNDAILLRHAHRAGGDCAALNDLAAAIAPSSERRVETLDQGTAFIAAAAAWYPRSCQNASPTP